MTNALVLSEDTASDAGFRAVPRGKQHNHLIAEAAALFGRYVTTGSPRARADLLEALSTSDFPIYFGAAMERELLAQYEQIDPIWPQFATKVVNKDFRPKKLVDLLGGRAILETVGQGAPYPQRDLDESESELAVTKRGGLIALFWEMIVNDDLDGLRDLPNRLGTAARYTEDYEATSALVDAAGAKTGFFSAGNGNAATALPLNTENVGKALGVIAKRKDSDGNPIINIGRVLMVPPALELTADAILNATEVRTTDSNKTLIGGNQLRGKLKIVVNPWLPVIATDGKTDARWFILPEPTGPRPAVALGFLRGHESPDLRVKADTGRRVGGGDLAPEDGSFDNDDIQYRIRHVLGSATHDPIATYVSNGS